MHSAYDPILVPLSIIIAILASYTALEITSGVALARPRARHIGVAIGAFAMGLGIWSMHFVAMLAFSIRGVAIAYDVPLVMLSIVVAIGAAALALLVVTREALTRAALPGAALAMGVAIAGMHYIGMWSMRLPATIAWHAGLVAASIFIAVAASYVALWLAFRLRFDRSGRAVWIRMAGGIVMGAAISGMHYTAMAAARFRPGGGSLDIDATDMLATHELGIIVSVASVLLLALVVAFSLIGQELGRRASLAEELRAAEGRLRGIIDSALDALVATDAHGVILEWNPNAEAMFGWGAREILGRNLTDTIIPERYRDMHQAGMRRYHETGEARILNRRIEIAALRRHGAEFPIELTVTAVRTDSQVMFTSFIRDITDQKRAQEQERENARRKQQLRIAEREQARLNELFEQAPAFIALLEGPDHVFALRNVRFDQLVEGRDLIGKPVDEALPELDQQGYVDLLDRVYRSGEPHVGTGSRLRLRREGGTAWEDRFINFVFQPVLDADGKVAGIFLHGVEVTDLVRAREAAEAASGAKSDFLSRMSHELRTPLNAILGFGQLLELDVEKPGNRESVDQILKAGRHLLGLIDEVLDIAGIESGRVQLLPEAIPLNAIVEESTDLVRHLAARHGVRIDARQPLEANHFVRADRQRLKQVLLNLLSNAVKYNRAGGSVTLESERIAMDTLRITVRDTGQGIPASRLHRLFTPFERLGAEESGVEGTGLGLALSRGLMHAMGGSLGVRSIEGEGSVFWLELPTAPPPAARPRDTTAPQEAAPSEEAGLRQTVLVVEDNLANLRLMERIFQRRPAVRLVTATLGREGLERVRSHRPDLVILDLNLPDVSGEEVLREIRGDASLAGMPVLMITGDAMPAQARRLRELGADEYITKPFEVQELLAIVDARLEQAAAGSGTTDP